MKYKGIELKEVTKPQLFDPPKKMLVWDDCSDINEFKVYAIVSRKNFPVICGNSTWRHCAEIPETTLVTHRELARWLGEGKGQLRKFTEARTAISYDPSMDNDSVIDTNLVRKWDDTEWHEPTREYLGLEDK